MAFSPDGQRIVTGSQDRTAKVWDAASGKELLTLKGHTAASQLRWPFPRTASGLSPAVDDQTAKVWDAASGKELLTLKGHSAAICSVAFSPDGQRIVTGSEDQTAKVWEAASGKELLTLKGHSAQDLLRWPFLRTVSGLSPAVRIRRPRCGRRPAARNCSPSKGTAVRSLAVAFSPDGQRIVTGSGDRTAKVWEAASGRELLTSQGAQRPGWVGGLFSGRPADCHRQ